MLSLDAREPGPDAVAWLVLSAVADEPLPAKDWAKLSACAEESPPNCEAGGRQVGLMLALAMALANAVALLCPPPPLLASAKLAARASACDVC